MKKSITLIILSIFTIHNLTKAQNQVIDTHPTATIFAIDYATGQEAQANYDAAILFKNAFIDLATNTSIARMQGSNLVPGRKNFVVTQMDPQTNGNAYQLVLQNKFLNQIATIYTFIYNVDQNALFYFDNRYRRYVAVPVDNYNLNNLNNCAAYGRFNIPQSQPASAAPPQADLSADAAPIDADVSVNVTPPALPDYDQPECPVDGYLWQPGYWAYGRNAGGYYWVPGAWVAPPSVGLLWTPPYWGYDGVVYAFHSGYWGNTIGFYGGVNYGFGYAGVGFVGGNWYGGHFRYNTAVVRVNVAVVHNVYVDRTVVVNVQRNHTSFNGQGGIIARPNDRELAASRENHIMATPEQIRNQRIARSDKSQFAAANGGKPTNVATARVMDVKPSSAQANRPDGINRGATNRPNNPGASNTNVNSQPNPATTANPATTGSGNRPGMNGSTAPSSATNPSAPSATNTRPGGNTNATQPGTATGTNPQQPGTTTNTKGTPGATDKNRQNQRKTPPKTNNQTHPAKTEKP